MHREPDHLTENDLRGMLKADLVEAAVELRTALHDAHDRRRAVADRVENLRNELAGLRDTHAQTKGRLEAVEEALRLERARVATLTGADVVEEHHYGGEITVHPPRLNPEDLEAVRAVARLLGANR